MKNFFCLFTIFILAVFCCQSQEKKLEYLITYQLKYQPDSNDVAKYKTEEMWLFSGDQSSLFLSKAAALKDSLAANMNLAMLGSDTFKETKTDFNFKIYKDLNNKKLFHSVKILKDKLYYTEQLTSVKWEIESESKEISGYSAQKATTSFAGRDYVAWFTPEIPIPDGPYKFSGLPGLILEIKDLDKEYVFSFKGLKKMAEPVLKNLPPDGYQRSDKHELLQLQQRYKKDPMKYINNYVAPGGEKITVKLIGQNKREYLQKRKERMINNPIELE